MRCMDTVARSFAPTRYNCMDTRMGFSAMRHNSVDTITRSFPPTRGTSARVHYTLVLKKERKKERKRRKKRKKYTLMLTNAVQVRWYSNTLVVTNESELFGYRGWGVGGTGWRGGEKRNGMCVLCR